MPQAAKHRTQKEPETVIEKSSIQIHRVTSKRSQPWLQ
jgi:hypothetical protein